MYKYNINNKYKMQKQKTFDNLDIDTIKVAILSGHLKSRIINLCKTIFNKYDKKKTYNCVIMKNDEQKNDFRKLPENNTQVINDFKNGSDILLKILNGNRDLTYNLLIYGYGSDILNNDLLIELIKKANECNNIKVLIYFNSLTQVYNSENITHLLYTSYTNIDNLKQIWYSINMPFGKFETFRNLVDNNYMNNICCSHNYVSKKEETSIISELGLFNTTLDINESYEDQLLMGDEDRINMLSQKILNINNIINNKSLDNVESVLKNTDNIENKLLDDNTLENIKQPSDLINFDKSIEIKPKTNLIYKQVQPEIIVSNMEPEADDITKQIDDIVRLCLKLKVDYIKKKREQRKQKQISN